MRGMNLIGNYGSTTSLRRQLSTLRGASRRFSRMPTEPALSRVVHQIAQLWLPVSWRMSETVVGQDRQIEIYREIIDQVLKTARGSSDGKRTNEALDYLESRNAVLKEFSHAGISGVRHYLQERLNLQP